MERAVRASRDGGVVLSTMGPFAKYGTPVVGACVANRRDYFDITVG